MLSVINLYCMEFVFMLTTRVKNDLNITTRSWVGDDSYRAFPEDLVRQICWRRRVVLLCNGDRRRFGRKGEPCAAQKHRVNSVNNLAEKQDQAFMLTRAPVLRLGGSIPSAGVLSPSLLLWKRKPVGNLSRTLLV